MIDQARIDELLLKWQEHHERGLDLSVQDLTLDCPEMAPELLRRIRVLDQLNQIVDNLRDSSATPPDDDTAPPVQAAADPYATSNVRSDTPVQTISEFAFLRPCTSPDALGQLGPFLVSAKIGEGGMGWVFRAEDPIVKRQIALKARRAAGAGPEAA